MDISLKGVKDVNKLLLMRNDIKGKITELNMNDNDDDNDTIKLLKKQYMNISNKISYIKNRNTILEKYKDKNRQYVKDNYEIIKEKNKQYQTKRRQKYKELEEFYNDNKDVI